MFSPPANIFDVCFHISLALAFSLHKHICLFPRISCPRFLSSSTYLYLFIYIYIYSPTSRSVIILAQGRVFSRHFVLSMLARSSHFLQCGARLELLGWTFYASRVLQNHRARTTPPIAPCSKPQRTSQSACSQAVASTRMFRM